MIDTLVVGSGGNGQTYFMDFLLSCGININDHYDADRLKHLSHPNKLKTYINRCIFLYNDPLASILSHYRRKWTFIQLEKLGNPYKLNKHDIKYLVDYFKLVENKKCDMYWIEYQFDNWFKEKNLTFPVLFLDFNDILKKKTIIDDFLGVKLNWKKFVIKERNSKLDVDNPVVVEVYDELYRKIKEQTS
jgi:hypothetical protein